VVATVAAVVATVALVVATGTVVVAVVAGELLEVASGTTVGLALVAVVLVLALLEHPPRKKAPTAMTKRAETFIRSATRMANPPQLGSVQSLHRRPRLGSGRHVSGQSAAVI